MDTLPEAYMISRIAVSVLPLFLLGRLGAPSENRSVRGSDWLTDAPPPQNGSLIRQEVERDVHYDREGWTFTVDTTEQTKPGSTPANVSRWVSHS